VCIRDPVFSVVVPQSDAATIVAYGSIPAASWNSIVFIRDKAPISSVLTCETLMTLPFPRMGEPYCCQKCAGDASDPALHIRVEKQTACSEAGVVDHEFQVARRRATRIKSLPRLANSQAKAAPIPLDAPVIKASGRIFSASR
jgi:hypothetical protein